MVAYLSNYLPQIHGFDCLDYLLAHVRNGVDEAPAYDAVQV